MESSIPKFSFADFTAKFPQVSMPIILGEDSHHVFSTENDPLPELLTQQFILPVHPGNTDEETTEFLPCFMIQDTGAFIALVWWKAGLLEYEYMLATFTEKGQLIDKHIIAFTRVEGDQIRSRVATIDEEWELHLAEGRSGTNQDQFDPTSSKTFSLEILANGEIAV
ncbi:MAG: hypothetical protein IPL65_12510 [Lewinellaceae bacterium]|nr:hypothetical protein [Lewinellaceae bacterium]